MKRTIIFAAILIGATICIFFYSKILTNAKAESGQKVLLILRERVGSSGGEGILTTNEAIVMKHMLEEAGFMVVIATASGTTYVNGDIKFESDLKLAEVKVTDYVGFIMPCLALGTSNVKPEEVTIAKKIVAEGKPVAAQRKGVLILAQAGVLAGKRYSYFSEPASYDKQFDKAIYSGKGVVQDGNIITSSYCPYHGSLDQTAELTQTFIDELNKK